MTAWQLGVNVHSGSVEARERRGGKAGEDAAAAWARWGHGDGRHGVVSAAVRSPVVGPACCACANKSERGQGPGLPSCSGATASLSSIYRQPKAVRTEEKSRPAYCAR